MNAPTAYTPLESLLLFHALRSEGVNSHAVFNRISDQLKAISIVREDPTFDSGRLSPDALRELYLWLLKEEVKRDLERQLERDDLLQNGTLDASRRKRKAESPTLPTVHEASQHAHLIPQLVVRLYARYREYAVRDIREQERKYHALKKEIEEIEDGKWDERLQRQRTASRTQSPHPAGSARSQSVGLNDEKSSPAAGSPSTVVNNTEAADSASSSKPFKGNKIKDVMNSDSGPHPDNDGHRRTPSGTILPPFSEMAPRSPHYGIPPKGPGPLTTQIPGHGYTYSPTSGHQSPYASHHGHPAPNPTASPQLQHSLSRPSSSPRPVLPPPPGMNLPAPSPVPHAPSPGSYGPPPQHQQQFQQPPTHPLSAGQPPAHSGHGYQANPAYQVPHTAQQGYYPPQPYLDRRTSYPQPQGQPVYQPRGPRADGYQHPQFPVDPSRQVQPQHYGQVTQQSPVHPQRPSQYPQYPPSAPTTSQRPRPSSKVVSDIIAALATPPRPSRNGAFKRRPTDLSIGTPMPSPVTEVEPLSPVLKRSEPAGKSGRSTRHRANEPEPEPTTRSGRVRGRAKRELSPQSVVSSAADDSTHVTRSQSVSTAAGALPASDDRPGSRGNVKVEPSTPAGFVEIPEAEAASTSGGRMTRKRRGTIQIQPQPLPKRSRQRSPDRGASAEADWATPPPRPSTVTATKNFHKMSAAIMNDINSHKHASYFANPVRDKDAPGYSSIIKQPQNFKAIRAAISAGTRAVNAAAANTDSPSTIAVSGAGGTGDGPLELERTIDLIPPNAIVNGAQLEKEVLRIFANAVMFNPGEDGMVMDTREMAEDVAAKLEAWRGAERETGEVLGGGEEDEDDREVGRGKRRKLQM